MSAAKTKKVFVKKTSIKSYFQVKKRKIFQLQNTLYSYLLKTGILLLKLLVPLVFFMPQNYNKNLYALTHPI